VTAKAMYNIRVITKAAAPSCRSQTAMKPPGREDSISRSASGSVAIDTNGATTLSPMNLSGYAGHATMLYS